MRLNITNFKNIQVFGDRLGSKKTLKRFIVKFLRFVIDKLIALTDFIYLGENRSKIRTNYLIACGYKE